MVMSEAGSVSEVWSELAIPVQRFEENRGDISQQPPGLYTNRSSMFMVVLSKCRTLKLPFLMGSNVRDMISLPVALVSSTVGL